MPVAPILTVPIGLSRSVSPTLRVARARSLDVTSFTGAITIAKGGRAGENED
jgi:hypothetical protein